MKKIISVLFIVLSSLIVFNVINKDAQKTIVNSQPIETIIKYDMEDGSTKDLKREWLKKIHQAAPDVNWESIENQNMMNRYKAMNEARLSKGGGEESIADGALTGEWFEMGSKNQAGSVFATTYDADTDELFLISAGGILFKGDINGTAWQSQNDLIRLDERYLVSIKEGNEHTLVSSIRGMPHFSTDQGNSWEQAAGFNVDSDVKITSWAKTTDNNEIFILRKTSYWEDFKLFVSLDFGRSYKELLQINTSTLNNLAICNPHHTEEIYFMEQIGSNFSNIYRWNRDNEEMELMRINSELAWANGRANLAGTVDGQDTVLYSYKDDNSLWKTTDLGETWTNFGELPGQPWRVGLYVSKNDPKDLFIGEVVAFRSINGGLSWTKVNEWWDYYQDVERKLHADIMVYAEHKDADGEEVLFVSNHGGLSKSYDGGRNFENIGQQDLNVSQYYDIVTNPINPDWIFAGSQDQGFQRGIITNNEITADLDQVISGDYGHITFTNNGESVWMVYPGGAIYYYNSVIGYYTHFWELDSDDETVWIPPIIAHPDPSENKVYLAGGNANGGSGSHLIELSYNNGAEIEVLQYPYNFLWDGKGEISAIEFNKFDPNIVYVASTGGGFWVSNNGGATFDSKNISVPNPHYLYGSDIMASKIDPNTIYISGSGYSNAPVIVSYDGGETFEDMSQGLPPTLAFELATNEEETLIFAGTEAGPYVYIKELREWFHMGGVSAPSQTYWSVEYLGEDNRVRFGTYGRGVWDFEINEDMVSALDIEKDIFSFEAYPNPFVHEVTVRTSNSGEFDLRLFDMKGQLLLNQKGTNDLSLDLSGYPDGSYILNAIIEGKQKSITIVKQGQ